MVTGMHLLALALLLVEPTSGDTLPGRVTDSDGAPVPSAAVLISELHRVATSGADGTFQLADVPPGQYTVIVRHVGFAPFAREVQVHGPTSLTVTLRRAPVWIEPVTITATRAPSAVFGSPLSGAELIRGPASVLYGSDALGGVVNVIPAELPDANGGPRMIRTGFELSGATNNAELEAAARVEGGSGPWAWRVFGIG